MDAADPWLSEVLGPVALGETPSDGLVDLSARLPDGTRAALEPARTGNRGVLVAVRLVPDRPVRWHGVARALGPPDLAAPDRALWCGGDAHPDLVVAASRVEERVVGLVIAWTPALAEAPVEVAPPPVGPGDSTTRGQVLPKQWFDPPSPRLLRRTGARLVTPSAADAARACGPASEAAPDATRP